MWNPHSRLRATFLAAFLFGATLFTGCAAHVGVGYTVYDPYYGDYHVWDNPEVGYYNTWIVETHHPHVEYRRLPNRDQRAYWQWRHAHGAQGQHHH